MTETDRGWTEEEAFLQLDHDPAHLDGPNCPWHGPSLVVVTKSYGGAPPTKIIKIGWRCRRVDCGNRWGWRNWHNPSHPDTRSKAHSLTNCWCGMPHRREDFL